MPIQMSPETLPALIVGFLLVGFGIVTARLQIRYRRELTHVRGHDDLTRTHADRQLRRRLQVAVMLGIVGILIPVGDQLSEFFRVRPLLFFVYWCFVLFLVGWTVLMAMGDWISSSAYLARANIELRLERRQLEEDVRRYHSNQNGSPPQKSEEA